MNIGFPSNAEHAGEIIDCRYLSLRIEYYQLTQDEIYALCKEWLSWSDAHLRDSFVVRTSVNAKTMSHKNVLPALHNSLFVEKCGFSMTQEGYVVSPLIDSIKSINTYQRKMRPLWNSALPVAEDYPHFWNHLFEDSCIENQKIQENILCIFREEGRKMMANCALPDMQSFCTIIPYTKRPAEFHGSFVLDIGAFSLQHCLQEQAIAFSKFASQLSEKYVRINARVQLQPAGQNQYLRYFGRNGRIDGSHAETEYSAQEWYGTYYVPGVEWYNIISPLAQTHLKEQDLCAQNAIAIENISTGGFVVRSAKPIVEYDISDSIAIKQYLSGSLYPGGSKVSLKSLLQNDPSKFWFDVLPRCNWAVVPVLDDEIQIIGSDLVFCAKLF